MKENNQKRIILSIMAIAVLIAVLAAGTYAFFAASIEGDDTSTSIQITASSDGTVIEFTGGEEVNLEGIYPRSAAWLTKDITIHTTGSSGAVSKPMYSFNIVVTDNDFDLDDIQYTFTNKVHDGVDAGYTETSKKTNMATRYDIAHGTVDVSAEVTVTYTLNVYFVNNSNKNQNTGSNQNVRFYITYGWGAPVELTRVVDGVTTKTNVPENTEITLDRPTKEGYTFMGWTAEGATIVGDKLEVGNTAVKITANFSEPVPDPVKFSTDSWATIAQAVKSGNTSAYKVGDTKEIALTGLANGEEDSNGLFTVRIANMTTPGVCGTEGFSETACGFVVEFEDIISQHFMDVDEYGSYSGVIARWPNTIMRKYLNGTSDNELTFTDYDKDTYEFVDNKPTIYSMLPDELKEVIANTKVVSGHGYDDSNTARTDGNWESFDKLYLLSTGEIWGDCLTADANRGATCYDTASFPYEGQGAITTRQLEYYSGVTTSTNNDKVIKQYNGSDEDWFLRSAVSNYSTNFLMVNEYGSLSDVNPNYDLGVAPAFRIA